MEIKLKELAFIVGGTLKTEGANPLIKGVSTDSRTIKQGEVFFALSGRNFDGHNFVRDAFLKGAVCAVVNGDRKLKVPKDFPVIRVKDTLFALGELARFKRAEHKVKVIGITGSYGKTTTKEMIGLVLSEKYKVLVSPGNYNNLVGVPLSLFGIKKTHDVMVLELGANQAGEISRLVDICQPDVGVLTGIGPVHLEGFQSVDGVEREKRELISGLGAGGVLVFNQDDERVLRLARGFAGKKFGFGSTEEKLDWVERTIFVKAKNFELQERRIGLLVKELSRKKADSKRREFSLSASNIWFATNAGCALCVARCLGISLDSAIKALKRFKPLAGRGSIMTTKKGIVLIDESYNANPVSMGYALRMLSLQKDVRRIAVLGEMKELGGFSKKAHKELGELAGRVGIDYLHYLGDFGNEVKRGFLSSGMKREKIFIYSSLDELLCGLRAFLRKGDLVLVKGSNAIGLEKVVRELMEE